MRNPEIWIFIFILGLLGLNWPVIEIFYVRVVPYLFGFWLLVIALVAFAVGKNRKNEKAIKGRDVRAL